MVTKFEKIARASEDVISTDLPASELGRFVELALKAKSQPLATVSFVPPLVDTAHPDIALIQERVQEAVERSRSRGEQDGTEPRRTKPAPAGGTTTGGSIGSLSEGYAANHAADQSAAC